MCSIPLLPSLCLSVSPPLCQSAAVCHSEVPHQPRFVPLVPYEANSLIVVRCFHTHFATSKRTIFQRFLRPVDFGGSFFCLCAGCYTGTSRKYELSTSGIPDLLLLLVRYIKSSQVVGLRTRVASIRTLIFSSPHPYAGSGEVWMG